MLFAVSDVVWQTLINGGFTLLGALAAGYFKIKLDGIAKVQNITHALVNSAMTAEKKISAVALTRLAEVTKHPSDIEAADLAKQALIDHEAGQAEVNAELAKK